MKHEALIAWTSLYIAVGLMALLCAGLAFIVTMAELRSGRWRPECTTGTQKALFLPRIWLRWQLNYLLGTPVILTISIYFASHVGISKFWEI